MYVCGIGVFEHESYHGFIFEINSSKSLNYSKYEFGSMYHKGQLAKDLMILTILVPKACKYLHEK